MHDKHLIDIIQNALYTMHCVIICLDVGKSDFVACGQQRHRPESAYARSGQRLCCSLSLKYNCQTCYMRNFEILASLCSRVGWFEHDLVRNLEDRVFCYEDRIIALSFTAQEHTFPAYN